jgi:hypothetical protein
VQKELFSNLGSRYETLFAPAVSFFTLAQKVLFDPLLPPIRHHPSSSVNSEVKWRTTSSFKMDEGSAHNAEMKEASTVNGIVRIQSAVRTRLFEYIRVSILERTLIISLESFVCSIISVFICSHNF